MDADLKPVLTGIQLVLEEIRELRHQSIEQGDHAAEDRKQAAEDRKQAAEDRKLFLEYMRRADEDRKLFRESLRRWDEDREEAAERFDRYVREAAHREKDLSRALAIIGKVGRDIVQTQVAHTRLLEQILRAIRAQGNGRHGNGRARS